MDNTAGQQGTTIFPRGAQNTSPSVPPPEMYEDGGSGNRLFIILGVIIGFIILAAVAFFIFQKISSSNNGHVTLVYWGLWEDPPVFQSVIDDFQRSHPNITVLYKKQDIKGLGKYVDRLKTRINGPDNAEKPDIFRFHNSWTSELRDVLHPFSADFVKQTGLASDYYPVVVNDMSSHGAFYGIPLGLDDLALFTNDTLFANVGLSAPTTWDDAASEAARLTVKNGVDQNAPIKTSGVALGGFDNVTHAPDLISILLAQNKSDLNDIGGSTRQSAVQGLSFYTYFATCHDDQCANKVWDPTGDESRLAFAKGNLAMFFGYSWDIPIFRAMNPNLSFSVHPLPHVAGQKGLTLASYWTEGISVRTKHPKEAEEFLKFLSKSDTLTKLYAEETKLRTFGEMYPRISMAGLLKNSILEPFVSQAPSAVSSLYSADTYDESLNTALIGYMGNAVRGIITNGDSPDSAVDTWAKGEKQLLQNATH